MTSYISTVRQTGPDLGLVIPQATVIVGLQPPHTSFFTNGPIIFIFLAIFIFINFGGHLEFGGPNPGHLLLLCKSATVARQFPIYQKQWK